MEQDDKNTAESLHEKEFYNLREASEKLGKSKSTLSRWTNNGTISSEPDPRTGETLISAAELQRYLSANKSKQKPKKTKEEQGGSESTSTKTGGVAQLKTELLKTEHEKEMIAERYKNLEERHADLKKDMEELKEKEKRHDERVDEMFKTLSQHTLLLEHVTGKSKENSQEEGGNVIPMGNGTSNETPVMKQPEEDKKGFGVGALVMAAAVTAVILFTGFYAYQSGLITLPQPAAQTAADLNPAAGE